MLNNKAVEILSKNFLLNVDMLECIRRGSAEVLSASNDGVLLIDIPSKIYMIYTKNAKIAKNLVSKIPDSIDIVAAHDKFSYDLLLENFDFNNKMICHNTVYTKKEPLKLKNSIVNINLISIDYKDEIIKYYTKAEIVDEYYIEDRLNANVMFGAFINDNLCGFIGSHTEGSIGMLEVLPQYKKRGIGTALQITATNDALANNRYPYGQVVKDNFPSASLQKKLGFELSTDKVYWLMK